MNVRRPYFYAAWVYLLGCAYINGEPPPPPRLPPERAEELKVAKLQIRRWDRTISSTVQFLNNERKQISTCFHPSQRVEGATIFWPVQMEGDLVSGRARIHMRGFGGLGFSNWSDIRYDFHLPTRRFRADEYAYSSLKAGDQECDMREWTAEEDLADAAEQSVVRHRKRGVEVIQGVIKFYAFFANKATRRCLHEKLLSDAGEALAGAGIDNPEVAAMLTKTVIDKLGNKRPAAGEVLSAGAAAKLSATIARHKDKRIASLAPLILEVDFVMCLLKAKDAESMP